MTTDEKIDALYEKFVASADEDHRKINLFMSTMYGMIISVIGTMPRICDHSATARFMEDLDAQLFEMTNGLPEYLRKDLFEIRRVVDARDKQTN